MRGQPRRERGPEGKPRWRRWRPTTLRNLLGTPTVRLTESRDEPARTLASLSARECGVG